MPFETSEKIKGIMCISYNTFFLVKINIINILPFTLLIHHLFECMMLVLLKVVVE